MALNGSGVREIVRVLGVSSTTVIETLKKRHQPSSPSNERLLQMTDPEPVEVIIQPVDEAEVDEILNPGLLTGVKGRR